MTGTIAALDPMPPPTVPLWPFATRDGDIIFVAEPGKESRLYRLGQWILRRAGRCGPARFSHVALAVGPGYGLHADGTLTHHQPIRDIVAEGATVRVYRRRGLTETQASRIVAEANRFDGQAYLFGYGGRSRWWGRLLRWAMVGVTSRTLPYCSQLVATAFAAAGLPLSRRPLDSILPHDIDLACQGPDWEDVTAEYYPEEDGRLAQISATMMKLEEGPLGISGVAVAVAAGRRTSFTDLEAYLDLIEPLRSWEMGCADRLLVDPAPLFGSGADPISTSRDLRRHLYDVIDGLPGTLQPKMARNLEALFPECQIDASPYEGHATLAALAEREARAASDGFVSTLTHVLVVLEGVAVPLGKARDRTGRFDAIAPRDAGRAAASLERLDPREALRLWGRLRALPPGRVRNMARRALLLHRRLAT